MIYGSVCSGIEAATVAWEPLGWAPAFFSEIEAFPRAVLAHHYPDVPCHGDFTTIEPGQYAAIDLLVGGTPCQDFSTAGLRAGLTGDKGRLTVEYCNLAGRLRPRWLVWENVTGVLSADDGNAFGIFLGALAELGYGTAYRVLDAQHFGVPQRRRRVFVIGCAGSWQRAAAVLFEPGVLSGDIATGEAARQENIAGTLGQRINRSRTEIDGHGAYIVCGVAGPLTANSGGNQIEATYIPQGVGVRRLTPRECERLQGFPDDYTLVPYRNRLAADSPRYMALGNSMAAPCMRWIGERIQMVEALEAA